ncbi:hypothetical protein BU24DRAFT_423280 [Aaosphaeria arxii CBS 175.79]|uniref:BZIP domain-containing protein n=1 Tax=Aaosphaeria arxii CBS 175.79 TaxID=1450172 RepID=A0A6A5XMZ1_9PLEO|nr:uncharacterized protein BU24DRAFT_423280 [Aaosphaeria arxii CBS 175.79]KAF2014286.1 hypothetical protein BU24DRAFT_423280 [Aaosphaeria arxii CBS 175.79]
MAAVHSFDESSLGLDSCMASARSDFFGDIKDENSTQINWQEPDQSLDFDDLPVAQLFQDCDGAITLIAEEDSVSPLKLDGAVGGHQRYPNMGDRLTLAQLELEPSTQPVSNLFAEPRRTPHVIKTEIPIEPHAPSSIPSGSPTSPTHTRRASDSSTSISTGRDRSSREADSGSKTGHQSARAKHLERNRHAARKCRSKQKKEQAELVEVAREMGMKNKLLKSEAELLKNDLHSLMNEVIQHSSCPDSRLSAYVQREADKIAKLGSSKESKIGIHIGRTGT